MKYWIKEVNGFTSQQKPIEYTINEKGEQVISPDYEPYPEYTDEEVKALFAAAAEQNAMIKDVNGVPTLVARPAPTADELRARREPLLEAFDKWEKAVLRGRETDSVVIMGWYQDLLDLIPSAFENIPERIKYYL